MAGWFESIANWFKRVLGPIRSTPDEQLRYVCEESGDIKALEQLLRNSLDTNESVIPSYFPEGNRRAGYTPLTLAARSGHLPVVEYLVSHKIADVNEKDHRWGATALHHAARKNHVGIVEYLLKVGGNVNAATDVSSQNATPLHWASSHGSVEAATVLINHQADVNARDKQGSTPLHWACYHGQEDIRKLLHSNGAEDEQTCVNSFGFTPADLMAQRGFRSPLQMANDKKSRTMGFPLS